VAFRGFILSGLRRRYRPWPAILLSSFLYAVYHMNVYQLLPAFCLGVVLGVLATRTGSVLPGMAFQVMYHVLLLILPGWREPMGWPAEDSGALPVGWLVVSLVCLLAAAPALWRVWGVGAPP